MIFCLILNPLNKRSFFFRIYQKKVWDFIQKVKETMHSSSVSSSSGSKHYSNMQQISDIFSQTESISQYIKSHLKDKANDETFILLQEFFGVFHDQMRINFDLRNQLTIFKKKQKNIISRICKRQKRMLKHLCNISIRLVKLIIKICTISR